MAEASYRMSEVLLFCDWETAKLPSIKAAVLTFQVKKCNKALRGVYVLSMHEKT